jgi:hypothetical protein
MPYRARQLLFSVGTAAPFYVLAGLAGWWILAAVDDTAAVLLRGGTAIAVLGVLAAVLRYWPTRRRPDRLYHLTTRSAATTATIDTDDDGTVTVRLRARRNGRPAYFFPRPPRSRAVVYWNLKTEPDVCIELRDIDYDGVRVRRRITGAYQLRGLVAARATVRPYGHRGTTAC